MFEQFESLPLIGALISGVLATVFFFLNGYREKQEGRREAETEHMQESMKQDQEIRDRSDEIEDTSRAARAHTDDGGELHDDAPDYHFRD